MSDDNTSQTALRSRLLAPHLSRFDTWQEFGTALDATWASIGITDAVEQLKWLRSPVNLQDVVIGSGDTLLNAATVPTQERDVLVLTADLLGFRFYETALLSQDNYLRLCQHLAEYYRKDKGTERWTDFLGFCFDAEFAAITTWTRDYKTFYPEGSDQIGVSVADGGDWYPTTHCIMQYDMTRFSGVHPTKMIEFFNYFANVNLVIYLTELVSTEYINVFAAASGEIEITLPYLSNT